MFTVCFCAAKVEEKYSDTSKIINALSATCNVKEIKYFQGFLSTSKAVLSGMGFFFLTKGMILKVEADWADYCVLLIILYIYCSWQGLSQHMNLSYCNSTTKKLKQEIWQAVHSKSFQLSSHTWLWSVILRENLFWCYYRFCVSRLTNKCVIFVVNLVNLLVLFHLDNLNLISLFKFRGE